MEVKKVTMKSREYIEMLVNHVLLNIHAKFRGVRNFSIVLQDDGAKPHTKERRLSISFLR